MPQLLDPYANPDTDGVFDDMDPAEEEREDLLGMMYAHIQSTPLGGEDTVGVAYVSGY